MAPAPPRLHDAVVLRHGGAVVAAATAAVAGVGGVAEGLDGVLGAVLGGVVALLFFGSDNVMSLWLREAPPTFVMAVAFVSYGTKIALLGLLLMAFRGTTAFSVEIFGAAVVIGTLAWLAVSLRLFGRARILYVDPGQRRS
jgi:ATP synthase protein I